MATSDPYGVLATRIRMGHYTPGSRLPSERDLAEELGVHRNTVRQVVSRLCADGLVSRRPNHRPIVQHTVRPADGYRTVALLMGNEAPFKPFYYVIRGCESVLREAGYRLVFMDTWGHIASATLQREQAALCSLLEHPVAGVVLWCQDPIASRDLVAEVLRRGMPVVAIDRRIPDMAVDFVGVDNVRAAQTAVHHLIELGHRRIAFVTGARETVSASLERERGFHEAMRRHGLTVESGMVYHVQADRVEEATLETARSLRDASPRPSAVFVLNDFYALHLVRAMRHIGLRVPEDIAVVGFDDIEHHILGAPMLTTIRQPFEEIGSGAASLLLERLAKPSLPVHHVLLETTLIPRASTAPLPAAAVAVQA